MICRGCYESQNIYNSGGNNTILSLLLVKYTLKQLNCFMNLILMIIKKEKIYCCEINELDNFSFTDYGSIFRFDQFIELKINEIDKFLILKELGFEQNIQKENEYIWLLKSLFIISLIYDQRIRLFIFGDHTKFLLFADLMPKTINIALFLLKCNELIDDFKSKHIQLNDIGHYITNEWVELGLYIFK